MHILACGSLRQHLCPDVLIRIFVFGGFAYLVDKIQNYKHELETEIQELKGILPICSYCKKIRNDSGEWEVLEHYISGHSEAKFSHGMCPDCAKEHYPQFVNK